MQIDIPRTVKLYKKISFVTKSKHDFLRISNKNRKVKNEKTSIK